MTTAPTRPENDAPLPRWDLGGVFPGLDSRAFSDADEAVSSGLDRLRALYDRHEIREGSPRPPTPEDVAALEEVLVATNELMEASRTLNAYLYARVTTDARDDDASGRQAGLAQRLSSMATLAVRLGAWVATRDPDALVTASPLAADHEFALRRAAERVRHQLSEAEEDLAAAMRLTGSHAWARLHRDVTARLDATVDGPGGPAVEPMSVVRGLAHDPDARVRRAAYEGELGGWERAAVPLAAALNGAIGERVMLDARRGWSGSLEAAQFTNNVDRATLDAMHAAVDDSLVDFRRYLRAKATGLGHDDGLPWWDLFAPAPAPAPSSSPTSASDAGGQVGWDDAVARVLDAFASFGPSLAGLARRAVDESWIDAGPRDGKVGGAYCLPVRPGESRVLMNFDGSADAVHTLAHELGHAYHNLQLAERTPLQRQTPMALAETASIFCETLLVDAGLRGADENARRGLLETDLQGSTQVVVDIRSRFLFESALCERRADRTLSVSELCDLMVEAQDATYGDGLAETSRHPYMWAVKSHYFTPFYNWPYTFGLLFGLGLFARYREDADRFRAGYDDLLAATGMDDAASLGARFGIDVHDEDFWRSSLDVIRGRIDDYIALVEGPGPVR